MGREGIDVFLIVTHPFLHSHHFGGVRDNPSQLVCIALGLTEASPTSVGCRFFFGTFYAYMFLCCL